MIAKASHAPATEATIDFANLNLCCEELNHPFSVEPRRHRMLREGLDEIEITLLRDEEIVTFEAERSPWMPLTLPHVPV